MTGAVTRFFAAVGTPVVDVTRQVGELWNVTHRTFRAILSGQIRGREVMRQAYEIGNRSLGFVTVTLGLLGLISVYQVANQMKQILPDYTMLGAAFLQMMIREFAPTICGLMIATRVGSGIAAEIGSMVVTEQVDALRMCNADPVKYLVVPRTVACAVMMVMLAIYSVLVSYLAGMVIGKLAFDIPFDTFININLVEGADIVVGLSKAFAYGMAIPIIAGHSGLYATGGSEGVGWATTRAVVNTSFAVIVLDLIISSVGYFIQAAAS